MSAKMEKAASNVMKMLNKVDDFLLEFGNKIL